MNIATIRDSLKTRLATVQGLRCYDTIPDEINPPAAVVTPGTPFIDYHPTMAKAHAIVSFEVRIVVQRASERAAQDKLDAYLSSGASENDSVIDAIEADPTLGSTVDDTIVRMADEYGPVDWNGITYLAARLDVDLITTRS